MSVFIDLSVDVAPVLAVLALLICSSLEKLDI